MTLLVCPANEHNSNSLAAELEGYKINLNVAREERGKNKNVCTYVTVVVF